ncbi:MAG: leucine-rich repeat-containing serine/threonine-protein kinase [Comamonas sp.]|jgi:Leucine-rich repeat (LRR) protein|uniref:leucine-rich repeat-containing protein kinase family protein n=1 Tax=Comamonas sp. TaxID=34028 RepID=UPI002818C6F6|nr:leucine-rich repeat-containing protein kinase family protein [Comamonas sp.]MDR0213136.1 leucine-rich repeat-containing serine/threonine-protein kinase [Comamonas sp.]
MLTLEQFHSGLADGSLARAHHIRLSDGLTKFPAALYQLAETLEILDLSGNQLTTLPGDLTRFARLRILFASNNPFTELPSVLGRMPQLEMVGFKACRIAHVPKDSLPPRLRWLILTDNRLWSLPSALGNCPRLQKLMLSCNQLSSLPASLVNCEKLELLRIASNGFEQLPALIFELPALAWLAAAGNPITRKSELLALDTPTLEPVFYQNLQIHELLGEGASGHIYRAGHGDRTIALKLFKAAFTSDGTPQSELAAGLAAGQHPHLLTPLAAVQNMPAGQLAMALPLLDTAMQPLAGPPSFESCTRDVYAPGLRISAPVASRLIKSLRAAVAHLHQRGLLHGDLYAHNTLCNLHTGEAVLSDMGAAALLHALPETQKAQLQQIELRALRILEAEIQALIG